MIPNKKQIRPASQCVSKYFRDAWGIDEDQMLETETVSSRQLLSVNRIDLVCKIYYIDCLENGKDMSYARELYRSHIEAFSDGSFVEPGLKTKNSIQDYCQSFEQLIADIRENGFDDSKSVVPVGDDGVILDGSHRVAIAIYYDIPLTVVHIPGQICTYDYAYFKDKGLHEKYLDFMALQYIRFSEQVYTVCLWPAANDPVKLRQVDEMIRSSAGVVYQKSVELNYHAIELLMITFYRNMDWTGSIENGFSGVASKARNCYRKNCPTTVYVISGITLEQVQALKGRIRELYCIENSSVHITDTHEEALEAGKMLLNQNSVHFMNYGDPFRDLAFAKRFIQGINAIKPCAAPETTLALYGIGEHQGIERPESGEELSNPRDYFYFWGVKLPSLDYVKACKGQSGESADLALMRQIEAFERKKRSSWMNRKENAKLVYRNISDHIARLFESLRTEIYRTAKVCYHSIKYKGQNVGRGEQSINDLQEVFLNLNTTTADYLVMRNWEGFYDDILLEGHNDIDLLCRDRDSRDIIVRLLDARPLTFDGFHYAFQYRGREVTLDTRIVGDGYYDRRWQRAMLKQKRLHPMGFYIMDPENYYYSLIYHAIYQKKTGLSEEYGQRLNQMSSSNHPLSQADFANQLSAYMDRNRYSYTLTMDQSVVKNFGATENAKRIRYPVNIQLHHFAQRVENLHLLQRVKIWLRRIIKGG